MRKITREQAIITLVDNDFFFDSDVGTPAMEFYIKNLMENTDNIYDIDRYAHLNTLFGYDIGFTTAMEIGNWLWASDEKERHHECFDILDLTYHLETKELLKECNEELNLGLSFDKWRTEDFKVYEYFN